MSKEPKQEVVLEPFDKSLDKAEKILNELLDEIEEKGKCNPIEFSQKSEIVKMVCNFHAYKTKSNFYLMARAIKDLDSEKQALLQSKIENEDF